MQNALCVYAALSRVATRLVWLPLCLRRVDRDAVVLCSLGDGFQRYFAVFDYDFEVDLLAGVFLFQAGEHGADGFFDRLAFDVVDAFGVSAARCDVLAVDAIDVLRRESSAALRCGGSWSLLRLGLRRARCGCCRTLYGRAPRDG
jgi:hypothetical protein